MLVGAIAYAPVGFADLADAFHGAYVFLKEANGRQGPVTEYAVYPGTGHKAVFFEKRLELLDVITGYSPGLNPFVQAFTAKFHTGSSADAVPEPLVVIFEIGFALGLEIIQIILIDESEMQDLPEL
jgi:hypothetical protein